MTTDGRAHEIAVAVERHRAEYTTMHREVDFDCSPEDESKLKRVTWVPAPADDGQTPASLFVARNIVSQLGDLWEVPVDRRQATNDQADRFVQHLIIQFMRDYLTTESDDPIALDGAGEC